MPGPGWIDRARRAFRRPAASAAVAPRIAPVPAGTGWAGRYTARARQPRPGRRSRPGWRRGPGSAYVPTAALVVRRAALAGWPGGAVFDPALRVRRGRRPGLAAARRGLAGPLRPAARGARTRSRRRWRAAAGPAVPVRDLGGAAGPRHPGHVPPLVLHPWPALAVAGAAGRQPAVAGLRLRRVGAGHGAPLRRAGVPARGVLPAMLAAIQQTWLGVGRYAQPVRRAGAGRRAALAPGGAARPARWAPSRRRCVAAARPAAGGLVRTRRAGLDPVRFALGHLADEMAYGAGVWAGALRARTRRPGAAGHRLATRCAVDLADRSQRTDPMRQTPGSRPSPRRSGGPGSGCPRRCTARCWPGPRRGSTIAGQPGRVRRTRLRAARGRASRAERELATTVMGQPVSLPVLISPDRGAGRAPRRRGRRGPGRGRPWHRDGAELVRQQAGRGGHRGQPADVLPDLLGRQPGRRSRQRVERARAAGAVGLILTLDWSFSHGRDWGSPHIPERITLAELVRFAPEALTPAALAARLRADRPLPDLTVPNMAGPASRRRRSSAPTAQWMQTRRRPRWDDVAWLREQWGGPFMLKGVTRVDDAQRAVDAGLTAISVSNHGGNNLDGTPATIRAAARHRRRRGRPGRGAARRRHPARRRRGQGAGAGRPRGA